MSNYLSKELFVVSDFVRKLSSDNSFPVKSAYRVKPIDKFSIKSSVVQEI